MEKLSTMFFGFGGFYLLIRIISKEEFGIWALFLSVTTLIEMARNGLIQNAVVKFLASTPEREHSSVMSASLALNILLTLISSVLIFFLAGYLAQSWHSPQLELMFKFYIFTTITLIPFSQFNFIQQANLDFKGIFISNFIRQSSFFIYIVYHFINADALSLLKIVNFQTFGAIIGSISSYIFSRKYLKLSLEFNTEWIKKLFHYGKFAFGTSIGATFFKSSDQMLLGYMLAPTSVALYNLSARIVNLFDVPINAVASIVFPQSSKRIYEEGLGAAKLLYEKSVGVILCMVAPGIVLMIVFAPYLVNIIAGPTYSDAVPILQITLLQVIFLPFARQFGTILDSIGKPQLNFYYILASIVINLVLNYFFIIWLGIIGTAYGTLAMCILGFVFTQVYLKRTLDIRFLNIIMYAIQYYKLFYISLLSRITKSGK